MHKHDFQLIINNTFDTIKELTATKGEEYSRDEDQLANFKRSAKEADITPNQVWLVLANKHLDAIKSYIRNGQEFSEPIEGRIDDAILYLLLLKGLIHEEKWSGHEAAPSTPAQFRPIDAGLVPPPYPYPKKIKDDRDAV